MRRYDPPVRFEPDDLVLEIGTGRGYQAAVLAELAGRVYSVELIDELAQRAGQLLKRQGYTNIEVRVANGYFGWPEHAPFHKVIVTAASNLIPPPLINQLKAGGRMVIPVGLPEAQQLVVAEKDCGWRAHPSINSLAHTEGQRRSRTVTTRDALYLTFLRNGNGAARAGYRGERFARAAGERAVVVTGVLSDNVKTD